MQVLKEEIRDRILKVSESLFFKKDFEKTSTREIAKEIPISVSNLYKYFINKEAILDEIVKSYYTDYKKSFLKLISHEDDETFGEDRITTLGQIIYKSIKGQNQKFVLLMDKSKGTKYAGFKDEIISGFEQHIRHGVNNLYKGEYIIKVFARNFFYGIVEIANHYKSDKWAQDNINLLVKYHMIGMSIFYQ